jgi:multidrug efflux pump subunit AcrA (membrane-fusion protein)
MSLKPFVKSIKPIVLKFRLYIILPIILIIILASVFIVPDDENPEYTVKKGTFVIDINSKGEIKAIDSYVIKAPTNIWGNARIVRMIPEGEFVKPGDFLIQFDAAEFTQRLQEAQNALETAEANHESKLANIKKQMADMESQLKIEEYNLEQTRLRAMNAIYEAENKRKEIEYTLKIAEITYRQLIEKIDASKRINTASLRQSELQVEQAMIKLQKAREDLKKLTLTSPASGLVVYKEIWDGSGEMSKVKVGSSPWRGQPLLEIPDQSGMKVVTTVNEVDISRLSIGLPVKIKLDAIADTTYTGKLAVIAALAHRDRRTKKNIFDVEVTINEPDERLKPGLSASCQIIVDEIADTLFIPIDALVTKDNQTGVYSAKGEFITIQTGKTNSDFVIVQKGLKDGDVIRLKKSMGLPGQKAVPQPGKPERKNQIIIHR